RNMSFLYCVVVGLIAGFGGNRFANRTGDGLLMDIAVGVAGSIVGELMFDAVRRSSTGRTTGWSLCTAALASGLVLWVWHAFIREA
ncbi:MAG TPA: hypothetical protein VG722_08560, partial [Tepidisphaeraceae bacterium]|nr:hypothetical protein [Tepidisphaeraceae bacterium]